LDGVDVQLVQRIDPGIRLAFENVWALEELRMATPLGAGSERFVRGIALEVMAVVFPSGSNSWSNSPPRDLGEMRRHVTRVFTTPKGRYPNGGLVRNTQNFAYKGEVRDSLPSQAFSIVGDDSKRNVHKTGGGVPEPAVIKSE